MSTRRVILVVLARTAKEESIQVLIETFIRKQLGLKAHRVTGVEPSDTRLLIQIDRLGRRRLRCGCWRRPARTVGGPRRERHWADLSMRGVAMVLQYRPWRVRCPGCGVRVEAFPWADPGARVRRAFAGAVVALARTQSWRQTARLYGLNWKSVAGLVRRAVEYGLPERRRKPLLWIGIDEVSRRRGHRYLTVVYDLERRVLLWVGEDRTEQTLAKFFTSLGPRRCRTVQAVCMDMWAAYAKAARAYYLKEWSQCFWDFPHPAQAETHLRNWMRAAKRTRLKPFKLFVRLLEDHLDGLLAWTALRLSNGALEGMNNKIKRVSHRGFGFRSPRHFITAIYHCCARLPLPPWS